MRAGPLSDSEVIKTLNEKFVNVWILKREIPALKTCVKGEQASILAAKREEYDTGSVDTFILTPTLEVLGHGNVDEFTIENKVARYLDFLSSTLADLQEHNKTR